MPLVPAHGVELYYDRTAPRVPRRRVRELHRYDTLGVDPPRQAVARGMTAQALAACLILYGSKLAIRGS